jgi:hypothetical protein
MEEERTRKKEKTKMRGLRREKGYGERGEDREEGERGGSTNLDTVRQRNAQVKHSKHLHSKSELKKNTVLKYVLHDKIVLRIDTIFRCQSTMN